MFGGTRSVLAALVVAMLLPTSALATTVRIGPEVPTSSNANLECLFGCPGGGTMAQIVDPTAAYEAPAAGTITSWRVTGSTNLRLRVFHEGPEAELIPTATSAPDTNGEGQANATSLPIRAGDLIGIDQPSGHDSKVGFREVARDTALLYSWSPLLAEDVVAPEPFEGDGEFNEVILVNADVVLAPVVSSLSPASGGTAGGTAVTITGKYLEGATGVTFGATPASSFGVDSSSQITAIAPAAAAGTVDVHVTGPGGLSAVTPTDRYTFTAPSAASTTSTSTGAGSPESNVTAGRLEVPVKLAIGGFSQSASSWRRGGSLPRISGAGGRAPVGTTFSFSLNEAATVSLEFSERVQGRRVGGRCVARGRANSNKPSCKRTVSTGSLPLSGHAGLNRVSFQGHLTRTRTLAPGTYGVVGVARDANGQRSASQPLSFTIAPR
jgi:hypothetical protein